MPVFNFHGGSQAQGASGRSARRSHTVVGSFICVRTYSVRPQSSPVFKAAENGDMEIFQKLSMLAKLHLSIGMKMAGLWSM